MLLCDYKLILLHKLSMIHVGFILNKFHVWVDVFRLAFILDKFHIDHVVSGWLSYWTNSMLDHIDQVGFMNLFGFMLDKLHVWYFEIMLAYWYFVCFLAKKKNVCSYRSTWHYGVLWISLALYWTKICLMWWMSLSLWFTLALYIYK